MIGIVRGEEEGGCGGAWEVDAVGWRCCDCGDAAAPTPAATDVVVIAGPFWCLRVGGLSYHQEYNYELYGWFKAVKWCRMEHTQLIGAVSTLR